MVGVLQNLTAQAQQLTLPLGIFSVLVCFLFWIISAMAPGFAREHKTGLWVAFIGILGATWTPTLIPLIIAAVG